MRNVSIDYEFMKPGEKPPADHAYLPGHMVFDVKMDFTRKARYVADEHLTPDLITSTYAGVVSRKSVRIALTYAALNDMEIMAADIKKAYLQAPTTEKHWTIAGPEWGFRKGTKMLVVRALYGIKSAGREFRNHLRDCMWTLGYESCPADQDVWMRETKSFDRVTCWEYLLLYTDDTLSIGPSSMENLMELNKYFKPKEHSIGPPKLYLRGKISKVIMDYGVWAYAFSSSQYVQEAVANVEKYLKERGAVLKSNATSPLSAEYRPELDQSPELSPKDAAYYQSLIGIPRWAVELGRVDISCEVSMMSSYLAMPRDGYLQQVFHSSRTSEISTTRE